MDTSLIARELASLVAAPFDPRPISAGILRLLPGQMRGPNASPWDAVDGFQLAMPRRERRTVVVDGTPMPVEIDWLPGGPSVRVIGDHPPPPATSLTSLRIVGDASPVYVLFNRRQIELRWPVFEADRGQEGDESVLRAPITGRIVKLFVRQGDRVAKGDRIAAVEAMKMEHVLLASRAGRVEALIVNEGEQVAAGAHIAELAEA
jgi:3-methylcrotonyl-CoA carboxylase alpha subunit